MFRPLHSAQEFEGTGDTGLANVSRTVRLTAAVRSYDLAAGAYVVKPMSCHDFVEAIEEVGRFWGLVNQPPVRGKRR